MTFQPTSRRTVLKSAAALALGAVCAPAVSRRAEAAPFKMRFSSSQANDPKFANGKVYYDLLVKHLAGNGLGEAIQISFFPDNQLGQEIDVINSVKLGVIDMMFTGTSIAANVDPVVGVFDLGYMFDSFPEQTKALDAGAAKLVADHFLNKAQIRIVAWSYEFGARSVLAKRPAPGPEELEGLKIRTLPNPIITDVLRRMGAAATPLAFGEIYTGLQAGVLDGLEQNAPTMLANKFYEAAKSLSLTEHVFSPSVLYFSDATYKRMDPKLREGFLDAADKAAVESRSHALEIELEAKRLLGERGVKIIDCDKESFRKRVLPQSDEFAAKHPDAKPVIDIIRSVRS